MQKMVRGKGRGRGRATFIEAVPNEVGVRVDARVRGSTVSKLLLLVAGV
jgi:hypothetical protein